MSSLGLLQLKEFKGFRLECFIKGAVKVYGVGVIGLKLLPLPLPCQPLFFLLGVSACNAVEVRMKAFRVPLVAAKTH